MRFFWSWVYYQVFVLLIMILLLVKECQLMQWLYSKDNIDIIHLTALHTNVVKHPSIVQQYMYYQIYVAIFNISYLIIPLQQISASKHSEVHWSLLWMSSTIYRARAAGRWWSQNISQRDASKAGKHYLVPRERHQNTVSCVFYSEKYPQSR